MTQQYATKMLCPLCKTPVNRAKQAWCPQCQAPLRSAIVDQILEADEALQACQVSYDALAERWTQWGDRRTALAEQLVAERSNSAAAPAAGPTDEPAAFGPAEPAVFATPTPFAAATATPVTTAAAIEEPATTETPPAEPGTPEPTAVDPDVTSAPSPSLPPRRKRASEVLTAPALLGVSGASLLISAAIVFVAIAWATVTPAGRGALVLGVAVAIGALAAWLRRLHLVISSGAVGVVSMGFAGTAMIAFLSESPAFAPYSSPAALIVAGAAGVVLARMRLAWVGPATSVALAATAVALTITVTWQVDTALSLWAWVITGTVTSVGLAFTHARWPWPSARHITRWAALGWLGAVAVMAALWFWNGDLSPAAGLAGFIPIVGLLMLARPWPTQGVVGAVALTTLMAPAIVSTAGASQWQQLCAVAGVLVIAIAVGTRLRHRLSGLVARGLVPAYAVIGISSALYAAAMLLAHIVAWLGGSAVPHTSGSNIVSGVDVWAGVAALATGLSLVGLKWWHKSVRAREWFGQAAVVGALLVTTGFLVGALGAAQMAATNVAHSTLASALVVAGTLLLVARKVWWDTTARQVSAGAGLAMVGLAAIHGVWALAVIELMLVAQLGLALAPVVVFAWWGLRHPWLGTPFATLAAFATLVALAPALGTPVTVAMALAVALAAVVMWLARLLPIAQQSPILAGLTPVFAWGLVVASWSGLQTFIWMYSIESTPQLWVAATALALALALASVRTGPWRARAFIAEPAGALIVIGAVPGALAALVQHTNIAYPWNTVGLATAGALLAAAGLWWWRDRLARRLTRVLSVLLVTVAGLSAVTLLRGASEALMPGIVLSVVAVGLLSVAARAWPKAAVLPASLLLTLVPPAIATRMELPLAGVVTFAAVGAAVALVALFAVPARLRWLGILGAAPLLALGAVSVVVVAARALLFSLSGSQAGSEFTFPWWSLALTVAVALSFEVMRRVSLGKALGRVAGTASALALVGSVVVATPTLASLAAPGEPGASARLLVAPVVALGLGWALVAWSERWRDTRLASIVRWSMLGWVLASALALQVQIANDRAAWAWGLAVVLGIAGAFMAVGPRAPLAGYAPATLLVTLLPFAVVPVAFDMPGNTVFVASATVAAVLLAGCAWGVRTWEPAPRKAVLMGAAPSAVAVAFLVLNAVAGSAFLLMAHLNIEGPPPAQLLDMVGFAPTWWHLGTLAAASAAALAWRDITWFKGWLPFAFVFVAASVVSPGVGVALLIVFALALLWWGRRVGADSIVAVITTATAIGWATGSHLALAAAAATATLVAIVEAIGWRTPSRVWGAVVAPVTAVIAGVNVTLALGADGLAVPVGLGLAMVAVVGLVSAGRPGHRNAVAVTAAAITVIVPAFANSPTMAGLALLLATAAWWRLYSAGLTWALWVGAAAASAGTAALLAGANIQVIEAYTAVPAAALLLIGVQWMRDRPQLRSVTALAPGLALALVPSYLALALEPNALGRTIALIIAITALALIGVRLKWLAPILATAVTAVVISVLQIIAGENLIVRLIAFAVVGSLLMAIASFFERLKELR